MGSIPFLTSYHGARALMANYRGRQLGTWCLQCPVEKTLTQISESGHGSIPSSRFYNELFYNEIVEKKLQLIHLSKGN